MPDLTSDGPTARIRRIGDHTHRVTWAPNACTDQTYHPRRTTVIYRQNGRIERVIKQPDGSLRHEVQDVKAGIPYTRTAKTTQQVYNLSDHALDADKDERPDGDENPDDTIRQDG
jgi:hypothetical protein